MKLPSLLIAALAVLLLAVPATQAGYLTPHGDTGGSTAGSDPFTFFPNPTKWNVGPNTAQFGGFGAPGGATWSIMSAGIANGAGDSHSGSSTSFAPILAAIPGGIDAVLDIWANASGFTNLGQVTDAGTTPGTVAGQPGDIRIGAYAFDGSFGVLAHAYQPGTAAVFSNGTIGGDLHFDNAEIWVNDPTDTTADADFDAFTVMLHELGHSLGLGHSSDSNAVMYPFYTGANRTLGADDIAGIQAIYGAPQTDPAVPEPASFVMAGFGLLALGGFGWRRKRRKADA